MSSGPSGRIPAIVDHLDPKDPINVWESASILLYLGRVYDKDHVFNFASPKEEQEMLNWIFFLCVKLPSITSLSLTDFMK